MLPRAGVEIVTSRVAQRECARHSVLYVLCSFFIYQFLTMAGFKNFLHRLFMFHLLMQRLDSCCSCYELSDDRVC